MNKIKMVFDKNNQNTYCLNPDDASCTILYSIPYDWEIEIYINDRIAEMLDTNKHEFFLYLVNDEFKNGKCFTFNNFKEMYNFNGEIELEDNYKHVDYGIQYKSSYDIGSYIMYSHATSNN